MIRLLGQTHQTADGRSYYIEACQVLPLDGEYDVMLFDISKTKTSFSMGIAFSKQLVSQLASIGLDLNGSRSLMEHGLAQLREQLDVGVEEDGPGLRVPTLRQTPNSNRRHRAPTLSGVKTE